MSDAVASVEPAGLRALDARARVAGVLAFAIAAVALRHAESIAIALALALGLARLARVSPGVAVRRLLAAQLALLPLVATLPFSVPGETLVALGPFSLSSAGLARAGMLWLRVCAILLAVLALAGGLDANRLGGALHGLGAPAPLAHLLAFTVRYLDLLEREYARLRTAMRARAFRARNDRHTWRSLGQLAGMLIVRSAMRAERVMAAMRCRGFTGRLPELEEARFRAADAAWSAGLGACLLALVAVDRW